MRPLNATTMKTEVKELIKAESRRYDFKFITEVMQRSKMKPARYCHSLPMPISIYEETKSIGVLDVEYLICESVAFFDFRGETVIISFVNRSIFYDIHLKIYHYLVEKAYGFDPLKTTVHESAMNFDRKKKPEELIK